MHSVIIGMYESGLSCREIGERLSVPRQTIYNRLKVLGARMRTSASGSLSGDKNPKWNGGRSIDRGGYVRVRSGGKPKAEHRVVMERELGRPLESSEIVHHKNRYKTDNRPENLELIESNSLHVKMHCEPDEMARRGRLAHTA